MEELLQQLEGLDVEQRTRALQRLQALQGPQDSADAPSPDAASPRTSNDTQQRVVVEMPSRPFPRKLRQFSGKVPVPSGEVEFETWLMLAKQLQADGSVTEADKKRAILQSLMRPALDTVSTMPDNSSEDCVKLLERIYGRLKDGQDILIDFHATYQESKEDASSYLNRIYLMLTEAAGKEALRVTEIPKFLLRQFIRGCEDDLLLQKLNLEGKLPNPPGFADLLYDIRLEEARRTERKLRRRKAVECKAQVAEAVGAVNIASNVGSGLEGQLQQLKEQMNELSSAVVGMNKAVSRNCASDNQARSAPSEEVTLRAQLQQLNREVAQLKKTKPTSSGQTKAREPPERKQNFRRYRMFCYKCGTDGHHMTDCRKSPNPSLVQEKLMQRAGGVKNQQGHLNQ